MNYTYMYDNCLVYSLEDEWLYRTDGCGTVCLLMYRSEQRPDAQHMRGVLLKESQKLVRVV